MREVMILMNNLFRFRDQISPTPGSAVALQKGVATLYHPDRSESKAQHTHTHTHSQ